MSKLMLLILAAIAIWWLVRGFRRNGSDGRAESSAPEQMVNCSHCGLYLPQSEAVPEGEKFYCCAEHRRLAG